MLNENVLIWQFSESGTVDGIETVVDLNIAKKNFFELCQIKKEWTSWTFNVEIFINPKLMKK